MRRGALTALVVAAALTAAGCSKGADEGQARLPAALCGVAVDAEVLRPVLVPGEEVTASGANSRCSVLVDGKRILALEGTALPPGQNYRATWDGQMPHGTPVPIGDEGRAVDTYVGAARKCSVGSEKRVFVSHVERFSTQGGDAAARKEALVRFMTAYFPAAQKTAGCTD
ncbi:hypothetical protein ACFW6S_14245 [Streptomyces sp. NPDC058740]|uniref:hypothetical protein n=1 Tax=unclassified Streptomyces TaxID=2593676 RepID=UPI0036961B37